MTTPDEHLAIAEELMTSAEELAYASFAGIEIGLSTEARTSLAVSSAAYSRAAANRLAFAAAVRTSIGPSVA